MRQTWRWFGPADTISIPEIRQTGAEGIVSALHHIAPGDVWTAEEITKRKREIEQAVVSQARSGEKKEPSGLSWDVVESVPVSETIKTKTGPVAEHYEAYRQSLRNLADQGLQTVCYNFMPILDWTRTDLAARMSDGATAMRFDLLEFCIFDALLLARRGAEGDYPEAMLDEARAKHANMSDADKQGLVNNIVAGLPGANDSWTLDDVRAQLATDADITAERLRQNLIDFLSEVVPTAEEVGIRLCCHPDDPPFSLLGLPRVMSTTDDYATVLNAVDSPANGATLCTGSLGVREDFDPADFVERLGSKIHFVHLRNTRRTEPSAGLKSSFYESEHLGGDTDMVATIGALLDEQKRRKAEGRADWQIPMRPDHGQAMLDDLSRNSMPGYPLIGRMRGLAELRGIMQALG
ncbi:MAG: mannonate dehydratase [Rhizobiales bacterium]|nr:mannonate dehydratase [Hyphomicrobiales bacterium]MBO6699606.1 mannonate dehydratase [Hyphomicrobiales bacterium]MBO6737144.1 mannonate dehydratase [Hyphomicrobiales bacterium]MBO6911782.1 mannonate dehydratase [Hyphomicrobiales bacterium]MBO6954719.1 mannonate dehydratase [Hyphomicrobiales bacterium]